MVAFFLDRSPAVMNLVLNFLRGDPVPANLPQKKRELLIADALFYDIKELQEILVPNSSDSTPGRVVSAPAVQRASVGFSSVQMKEISGEILALDKWFTEMDKKIAETKAELRKQKAWEDVIRKKIAECYSKEKMKLNIGGKIFCTSRKTLISRDCFFRAKFSGNFSEEIDDEGCYFIDKDGTYFEHILQYLRDGTIPKNISETKKDALALQADYYNLPEFVEHIKPKAPKVTKIPKVKTLSRLNGVNDHHFHFGIEEDSRLGEGVIWAFTKWSSIQSANGSGQVAGPFAFTIPENVKLVYAIVIGGGGGGNGFGEGSSGGGGGYTFLTFPSSTIQNRKLHVSVGDGSATDSKAPGGTSSLSWNSGFSNVTSDGGMSTKTNQEGGTGGICSATNVSNLTKYFSSQGGNGACSAKGVKANSILKGATGGGGSGNSTMPLAGAGTGEDGSKNKDRGIATWIDSEDKCWSNAGISEIFPPNLFSILVKTYLPPPDSNGGSGRLHSADNKNCGGYFGGGGGGSASGSGFSGQQGCCCLFWFYQEQ